MADVNPSRRVMYVTMGTSLFTSATWEPTEELCELVEHYEEWTQEDTKISPERRLMSQHSSHIRGSLRYALHVNNAEQWAKWLPADLRNGKPATGTLLRYSAELTTILKLAATAGPFLKEFLHRYAQIRFIYDDRSPSGGGPNLPFIAAAHLAHYLNFVGEKSNQAVLDPVSGISSHDPEILLGESTGMPLLAKKIKEAALQFSHVEIVASGGYKVYGVWLAGLLSLESTSVRLHYLHEEGGLVISRPAKEKNPDPDAAAKERDAMILRLFVQNAGNFGVA